MATWRMTVRTTYPGGGGPGYNVFHYRDAGGDPTPVLQDAVDALQAAYTILRPSFPPSVTWSCDGRMLEVGGDTLIDLPDWSVSGSNAATTEPLPTSNQIVVGWRTSSNSRSGRGRTFLAGWTESSNVTGIPNSTALDLCRAFAASIVSFNGGLDNGAFQVYSQTQEIGRDITSAAVRPVWAVLRSRRD